MEVPAVLSDFVTMCRSVAIEPDARSQITGLMRELVADSAGLTASVSPMDSYDSSAVGPLGGDVILYEDSTVTVVLVDTLPGVLQPPHDHLMPAVIGMFQGCEQQRFWARTADGVTPATGRDLHAGEVLSIGTEGIHAIGTSDEIARGVHVYLGSLSTIDRSVFHPETLEEQPLTLDLYNEFCRSA
jgi:predicted metal-dependent enzyme (double-stranded beta helix superfamily)